MKSEERLGVYTPFLRRFTDERARDIAETKELYEAVRARYQASLWASPKALRTVVRQIAQDIDTPLLPDFCATIDEILSMEEAIFGFPDDVNLDHLSLQEQVDLNRYLRAKDHFLAHEADAYSALKETLQAIFAKIAELLPKTVAPSPFVIPLAYALPDPKLTIDAILGEFWTEELKKLGLFVKLCNQLYFNLCEASGIADPQDPKKPFLRAHENGEPISVVLKQYLKKTPFLPLFETPLPLQLTHEEFYTHCHCLGGSGAGKTQLLQSLILHWLTEEDRPSLVVVDSQGDLINKLLRLDVPGYKPILISPKETPALNVFDVKNRGYDEFEKEQVTAGVLDTLEYLFAGFGIELTGKMESFFRPMCRLMLSLPETMGRNATLVDLIRFTENPAEYVEAIQKLPDFQRRMFERDVLDPKATVYKETRDGIRYRLQALMDNPTLQRLFSSTETKLDLFERLNEGVVILVDTNKAFLKGAAGTFGQIAISLVLQAILERAMIKENDRKATFLVCDEAHDYFAGGDKLDNFLTETRKYKCGLLLAHQFLEQATPQLRASLASNTAIKMASGVSDSDARSMARDMRTTPEFILSQPRLHFACHIRNVTPQAVSIPVHAGRLESHPRISDEDFAMLMARNKAQVASSRPRKEENKSADSSPDPGTEAFRDC